MVNIAVLVKQVPDTWSERRLDDADWTLDRDAADAVIDEIDTRGVETALQVVEAHGGEVTVLTMGPARATEALRKALAMGAHKAVHVLDDALAGSCALQTSAVLAAAVATVGADLVITGNESTDGRTGTVASMLAERLGLPQVTSVRTLEIDPTAGTLRAERVNDAGYSEVTATLPAVVSVTEKINEPRYPNFKGIMSAKKKTITTLGLGDLGLDPSTMGLAHASTAVLDAAPRPAKQAGEKITDDGAGSGAAAVVQYLTTARLI
ncbi:electron transfer flavoprotein subunit beta/FixA family protein [Nakamurella flavida]|uniref:Electron transfer flavoprotein subunit beta n=1 Tax=Nakamurella flavida TaxID=363630 RepID=A0A938YKV6_9ACTN|nr:electron transfer flavoprotein subunit beta/FixA family protein [Nakamurella flavida]MBM9477039.1 electron transfer flavoprotein subunit beta/FixA family protein [Nakamurella flavida]MDP9779985.1 electron transfer flavoprotein beta subunit [Nakamurella flavida]